MGKARKTSFRLATIAAASALLIGACSSGGDGSASSDNADSGDSGSTSED